MNYVIILFGLLISVLALFIQFRPKASLAYARSHAGSSGLYLSAIFARIILGLLLVLYADQSRYPAVLEIIGYLVLAGGVILALIGRSRFERLLNWFLDRFSSFAWLSGSLGVLFGLFLIYAVT